MKKTLLFALCALLSANADARTLYVDASRPNNNGNGLSAKQAKKTIQAAINIAKKGDTIVVAAGKYSAPLKTKNKKIAIKAKSGKGKTFVRPTSNWMAGYTLDFGKGNATKMAGFTVSPKPYAEGSKMYYQAGGVKGGSLSGCVLERLGDSYYTEWTFLRAKFVQCALNQCFADTWGNFAAGSTFDRCKVVGYCVGGGKYKSCRFTNTLVADAYKVSMVSCILGNCTVAGNGSVALKGNKIYNTILNGVAASQFKKSKKNALKRCYRGSKPKFVSAKSTKKTWVADENGNESRIVGADVYWYNGISNADVHWEIWDEGSLRDSGDITVSGKSDEEILAAAKAQVGDNADCSIVSYTYEEGFVTVAGTTTAAILAAAKAKVGKPDATYSIDSYEDEWGYYQTENVPGNYHVKKGSPCINKGTMAKAVKKLYGKKDLDGRKRVRGKSVDIGCYEY